MADSFATRFAAVRSRCGPLALGLDPSGSILDAWGIGDSPAGVDRFDLVAAGAIFLAPGVGRQGANPGDVAQVFAACPERVIPSASRSLLAGGPDVARLRAAVRKLADEFCEVLAV
jgi:orotidine-5'-phosphate decarboxylase